MKKFVALMIVMALALTLCLGMVPALAEDYTIRIYSNSAAPERVTWLV